MTERQGKPKRKFRRLVLIAVAAAAGLLLGWLVAAKWFPGHGDREISRRQSDKDQAPLPVEPRASEPAG
ncbi:MAG: hypothetical protein GWP05_11075 [Anaerolineaceae bacterium]|nr:hypothetical protein [Anaerolineaceae bacterium]